MSAGKSLWPVASFTAAYLIAATTATLIIGNSEFLLYIVAMFLIILAVWFVDRTVNLTPAVLWCLSLWGLLHMAGGLVGVPDTWPIDGDIRVLYSLWLIPERLKYDHVVHAYGFGVATWVCWQGIRAAIGRRGQAPVPTVGLVVLAALSGLGLGALNELIEFAATLLVPETNVGGYINTGWDLAANFVGAAVAAIAIWLRGRRQAGRTISPL